MNPGRSELCSETNRLGLSATYCTIIISAWRQISEAVYKEVNVIQFSAPSAGRAKVHWSRAGFAASGPKTDCFSISSFCFPDVCSPDAISPHFILSRCSWQHVMSYLRFNKAEQPERGRKRRQEEIWLTG